MDRKNFIKKSLLGATGVAAGSSALRANDTPKNSTYDKLMQQVGFNHLPNKEYLSIKIVQRLNPTNSIKQQ